MRLSKAVGLSLLAGNALAGLENPPQGSTVSGIGLVSGWVCGGTALTAQFDANQPVPLPYGSSRADTGSACPGNTNTGFGLLFNFNGLGVGTHTVVVRNGGQEIGRSTFNVTTFGTEYLSDRQGTYSLPNFPDPGVTTTVAWSSATQNFGIVGKGTPSVPIGVNGYFYGAFVYDRSGCTGLANGSYYEALRATAQLNSGNFLSIRTDYLAGGYCIFQSLVRTIDGGAYAADKGDFSCSSGAKGTWSSPRIDANSTAAWAVIQQKFTVGETCSVAGNFSGARWRN